MTILNLTVAPDRSFAQFSADSAACAGEGAIARTSKIRAIPHLRAVMIGAGALAPIMAAAHEFSATDMRFPNVASLARHIPDALRRVSDANPGAFVIALAGWVQSPGGIASLIVPSGIHAWLWASDTGFAPVDVVGTTTAHPTLDTKDASYPAIAEHWDAALRGRACEELHRHLVRNQLAQYRAGRFPPGIVMGGLTQMARLDRSGISIKLLEEAELHAPASMAAA